MLSILIATVAWRQDKFLALLGSLLPQAEACAHPVEVVGLQNNGGLPLGRYREALLRDARGGWLCFIDDDDTVPADYADVICGGLAEHDPDVVGFLQECEGLAAPLGVLSLRNVSPPPGPVDGVYLRCFTHMMPVRTAIARKGTFLGAAEGHTGEDMAYVNSLLPVLYGGGIRELFLPRVMYTYRWSAGDTTQAGPADGARQDEYRFHPPPEMASPCFRWCDWKGQEWTP